MSIISAICHYFRHVARATPAGKTFSSADLAAYVRAMRGASCSPESVNRELRRAREKFPKFIKYDVVIDGRNRHFQVGG